MHTHHISCRSPGGGAGGRGAHWHTGSGSWRAGNEALLAGRFESDQSQIKGSPELKSTVNTMSNVGFF